MIIWRKLLKRWALTPETILLLVDSGELRGHELGSRRLGDMPYFHDVDVEEFEKLHPWIIRSKTIAHDRSGRVPTLPDDSKHVPDNPGSMRL